jgi:hypothetical protein
MPQVASISRCRPPAAKTECTKAKMALARFKFRKLAASFGVGLLTVLCETILHAQTQSIQNGTGLRLLVTDENNPTLAIVLPGHQATNRSLEVIFLSTSQPNRTAAASLSIYTSSPEDSGRGNQCDARTENRLSMSATSMAAFTCLREPP